MKYLASVRMEAMSLPSVVRAPNDSMPTGSHADYAELEGYDDYEDYDDYYEDDDYGYYEDGAYVGRPMAADTAKKDSDTQSLYHEAMCRRFDIHRARLRTPPTAEAAAALDNDHPTTCDLSHSRELTLRTWRYHLRNTSPVPAQLACMDTQTVLKLLPLIEGQLQQYLSTRQDLPEVFSVWIWNLLGRLDDVGQLSTHEVGTIRILAKTAIWMISTIRQRASQARLQEVEIAAELGHASTGETTPDSPMFQPAQIDDTDGVKDEVGPAREDFGVMATLHQHLRGGQASSTTSTNARPATADPASISKIDGQGPNMNTLATLDMILTVAGEFFGQRDLLESRLVWDKVS